MKASPDGPEQAPRPLEADQAVVPGTAPNAASLAPTRLLDAQHPQVVDFAKRHATGSGNRQRAVSLLYAVRDGFRYDPYRIDLSPAGMCASSVLERGHGWCVPKAALLVAAARAAGIPARMGFADVRNHLSTERMRQTMKTDLFIWHGYADLWIEGRWLKATPAFNVELCEKFGLLPLDFDGRSDSIYHAFDRSGQRHMEYVKHRGAFDDMPLARIQRDFAALYGGFEALSAQATQATQATRASQATQATQASFEDDVQRETGTR
jgi:transglutaminase-like putative cysteine protease